MIFQTGVLQVLHLVGIGWLSAVLGFEPDQVFFIESDSCQTPL